MGEMDDSQQTCVAVSSSDTKGMDGEMELSKFKDIMSEKFSELMENIDPHI